MPVRERPQPESDDPPGTPEWMVTFSDCMTLLLTFFVLLISFSSFDVKVFRKMESALAEGLASVSINPMRDNPALEAPPEIVLKPELIRGSEKPTVDGKYQSNPKESLDFLDFERQKVFLLPSDRIFWGRGTAMSAHGRQILTDVAALLNASSNRIIVSEHALDDDPASGDLGLQRAWQMVQFFVGRQKLDRTRFSISAASTVSPRTLRQSAVLAARTGTDRAIEIVILDRSIYR